MYIPPNSNVISGDRVRLQSGILDGLRGDVSVGYWYIMTGSRISSLDLNVTIWDRGTGRSSSYIATARQPDVWNHMCQNAHRLSGNVSVIFEARYMVTVGNPSIAIDDVIIQPGTHCTMTSLPVATLPLSTNAISVSCNFDNSICGYTNVQQKVDDFDWTRNRGPTGSTLTGPDTDHTTGKGFYMYVEASSPRVAGDYAMLESPSFVASGNQRLHFWYSVYGLNIGALRVYIKQFNQSTGISSLGKPVFQDTQAVLNGSIWKRGCFEIPKMDTPSQVVFEGIIGIDYKSDIAIDDVVLDMGNCSTLPGGQWSQWGQWSSCSHTCGNATRIRRRSCSLISGCKGSSQQSQMCTYVYCTVSCNFDSGICGYTDMTGDFSWIRNQGSTISTATGPNSDHTTGKDFYMYIETSSPRVNGDTASIQSPEFDPEGSQRLTFWYSAYGSTIGSLTVSLTYKTFLGLIPHTTELFYTNKSTSTSDWQFVCANIPPNTGTKAHITFQGVRGTSYYGDIAIDDVKLERGQCSSSTTTVGPTGTSATTTSTMASSSTSSTTSSTIPTTSSSSTSSIVGTWSHWYSDPCSTSCGNGTRTRIRHCSTGSDVHCGGSGLETIPCNDGPCPVHGNWGSWSSYSQCSVSCGSGNMTRYRSCDSPVPQLGGNDCIGANITTKICHQGTCVVNGNWSDWQTWSTCSKSCDSGTRTRDRSCDNPTPKNGGNNCTGNMTEVESCNNVTCPEWSHWFYEPCSATCGNGTMQRIRHCSTGNDVDCGGGESVGRVFCNDGLCPVHGNWGSWSSYSQCSVSCGSGNMTRYRSCDSPVPQLGGNDCVGVNTSTKACALGACIVDGSWSNWNDWTMCTVSCNNGTRSRTRSCDNPAPTTGGLDCNGNSTEIENCNVFKCPEWSEWFYGNCQVTCGNGNVTRIRHCSSGVDQDCGPQNPVETISCNEGPCPVDGGWGDWTTWTPCSQSCGNGTRDRNRTCDNPAPQDGGLYCRGSSNDTEKCLVVECPYWLPFQQITACSVTCGQGFAQMKRNCSTGIQSDCPGSPYDERPCKIQTCV
ncbi:hypothetical protein ACF0H5_024423 [Mactra antiquata]